VLLALAEDPAALSEAATKLAQEKRYPEAAELWRKAAAINPRFFPALFNLGFYYYSAGRFEEAVPWLERGAAVQEDDFNTRYVLGAAFSRLGRPDAALRQWRVAQRLRPGNSRLLQMMSVEYGKGRYFNEAAATARLALERSPEDQNLYYIAIKALQDAGDAGGAAEIAARAVKKFPSSARASFEHGFHLQKLGKVEEAMAFLRTAMKLDPSYEEPPFFMGDLLVKLGKTEEAIPYLRTAIRNRNDYVPARVLLARALMKLERWEEALSELNATVALDPKHPQPHLLLSQIYFRLGDEERARKARETSLELRRRNPELLEAVQGRPFPQEP
jgi:tetratricopeptide (TPR) repeat protein